MTTTSSGTPPHAIAIVAATGRFPGAEDPQTLFSNLCAGREGITRFEDQDLDPSIGGALRSDPNYVKARGVLQDFDCFDADFFGMRSMEACVLDPQHRVLLELAWRALEECGHRPDDDAIRTGVFVGSQWSHYLRQNLLLRPDILSSFGEGNVTIANEQDFLATRISYKLGLRGPSYTIATACSTSLVAIVEAARSLVAGKCDLALAGGVSIVVPVQSGYLHEPGGMLSSDGHCRPLDADASGTVFSDGAGIVALRRLADAVKDGDPILAVMRGFQTNNDGDDKVSFTAPSISGQVAVLQEALAHAEVDPATVGYVEMHGTATPMGDPIEFAALTRAYGGTNQDTARCVIGSVKSSVGHLVHAAGVTGLIVAALAVRDGVLPPVANFCKPNEHLGLDRTRFSVLQEAQSWPRNGARRAAVSSFGVGGTNAHVILEESPLCSAGKAPRNLSQWLRLSARSSAALDRRIAQLHKFFASDSGRTTLSDVAYTLSVGRVDMPYRAAVRATSNADALRLLATMATVPRGYASDERMAVLQFPGHGAQRIGMARELYDELPVFRERIDRGLALAREQASLDLQPILLGPAPTQVLADVRIAHPALFLFEYAVAGALEELGLRADAFLGCSLGEFAAGTAAGVWQFEDAMAVIVSSSQRLGDASAGAMCTAYCSAPEVREVITAEVVLGA